MADSFVSIEDITKKFVKGYKPALHHINAAIPKGTIVGLVGPDGAGKTTLLRLIAGLLLPTDGKITVGGYNTLSDQEALSQLIGYMPQKFGLYEDLTVMQNLHLYADIQGVYGEERARSFAKLLEFTRLGPFIERVSGALSGGMKQKLGLACTLIRKPSLLLLDEPSVGVDPLSRRDLWAMVQKLAPEGITIIWSTSYLDEAEKCEKVLVLNEGTLLYYGDTYLVQQRVQERTYLITDIQESRRSLIEHALQQPYIIDATVHGKDIRIVLQSKEAIEQIRTTPQFSSYRFVPTPSRFEDVFIDLLGGVLKEPSQLAKKIDQQNDNQIVVEAKRLTKQFGSFTAADDISFTIKTGEIFGLLGPNGAGKSTTFKMMCGLLTPTFGEGFVNGLNLQKSQSEARSHLGYMAQKFSLYGNLSVQQNLFFFAGIYNLWAQARKDAIEDMIETFHLGPYLHQSADALPLGFKQRLALSCAIMHKPKVLFLDEPTSGVDPLTRREFWGHINSIVQKGMTVMVTTHFMDEAEYCDKIALIYQSKMIAYGTPDELKSKAAIVSPAGRQNKSTAFAADSIPQKKPNPTLEDAFISLIEEYDTTRLKV